MNGGKTGWPAGLLQDDCRGFARWLSSRLGALHRFKADQAAERTRAADAAQLARLREKYRDADKRETP